MILVTGATGMIGRALVRHLLLAGYDVRAHARRLQRLDGLFEDIETEAKSPAARLEEIEADLSTLSEPDAEKLCRGCSAVVHTAGIVHQPQAPDGLYQASNIQASKTLARAAASCRVEHFIFLSSSSVYGNRATTMVSEDSPLCGDTPYSASKIATEEYLQQEPPVRSTTILRPALVFGEGDRGNMIALIRQIAGGRYFIVGEGSARKSLIYASDLALAVALLLKAPRSGLQLFNMANPEPVSVKELSETIFSLSGRKGRLSALPAGLVQAAASAANCLLKEKSPLSPERLSKLTRDNSISTAAFTRAYGFHPEYDLRRALGREIDWWRTQLRQ
jgi:GlcNAc-P-P-Und epimerase